MLAARRVAPAHQTDAQVDGGHQTSSTALVDGAGRFLLNLIGACDDLDAEADTPDPELAPVEYHHAAMVEAAREMRTAEADLR